MAKKKLAHGTIFAVPLPDGTYICGRVLLDIEGVLKRRLFPADSSLPFFRGGHLIEMYSAIEPTAKYSPSPVLIPGAFVEKDGIGNTWPIVAEMEVDPRSVEFPESLIGFDHPNGQVAFECGEISIPLAMVERVVNIADRDQREIMYFWPSGGEGVCVRGRRHSAFLWPFTCLHVMGRVSEVPAGYKMASLEGADLRISPHRAEIYKHLPFRMKQSYFEKQAMLGLHFERLYE